MQKAEFIRKVSKETGVSESQVKRVIEGSLTVAKATIISREPIFMRGFGTLMPVKRMAKKARNIGTGETLMIPSHFYPVFKPAKEFKTAVAKPRS